MSSMSPSPAPDTPAGPVDLSALVAARICHDLGNPIGAIGNGVELLGLDTGFGGAELELVSDSVEAAQARLRFCRMAFGEASAGQTVAAAEAGEILTDRYRGTRVSAVLSAPAEVRRRELRCAFLAALCVEAALPAGGEIALRSSAGGWLVTGTGPRIAARGAGWSMLSPSGAELPTARNIQFALLPRAVAEADRTLLAKIEDAQVLFAF